MQLIKLEAHQSAIAGAAVEGEFVSGIWEGACLLGVALRKDASIKRPVYVSVGHKTSLQTAVKLVQRCCRFRQDTVLWG